VTVLGAILAGLFLMHGTSAAAGGCQRSSATTVTMPAPATLTAAGHAVRALPAAGAAAAGRHAPHSVTGPEGVASRNRMLCSSTPPRRLLTGILLAAALGMAFLGRPAWRPGTQDGRIRPRRAHDPPGRALLTVLCVSRT
jgi:hypothetical protein